MREEGQVPSLPSSPKPSRCVHPYTRLFYRYQDLAPQLVPLDYTSCPDVKVPYELIGSMPELKVCLGRGAGRENRVAMLHSYEVRAAIIPILWVRKLKFMATQPGCDRDRIQTLGCWEVRWDNAGKGLSPRPIAWQVLREC